mmetsp:Transcript_144475/g.204366  ORF Transcript_144475/g.204366 Transcript_144475/m.204366 type:complete len:240 (+) Transcript_144475:194-913(+)
MCLLFGELVEHALVLRHLIPQRHVGKHHSGQRLKQDARDHQTVSVAHSNSRASQTVGAPNVLHRWQGDETPGKEGQQENARGHGMKVESPLAVLGLVLRAIEVLEEHSDAGTKKNEVQDYCHGADQAKDVGQVKAMTRGRHSDASEDGRAPLGRRLLQRDTFCHVPAPLPLGIPPANQSESLLHFGVDESRVHPHERYTQWGDSEDMPADEAAHDLEHHGHSNQHVVHNGDFHTHRTVG